ncbi:MAG TPA: co-chaperone DjlA [Steroidobacteraceae bacterium]|nr:co-chaperone DjlA [Steroidobacteraceae bacterium]
MLEGWYGKIIGAILGYIIGRGLFGAIVGFVIGHQFDVVARRNSAGAALGRRRPGVLGGGAGAPQGDPAELRRAFFEATFQVMGHVAKSDGRVTEQEIDAAREAMRRFSLSESDRRRAIELFTAGKNADFPLEGTLERLRWLTGDQPDLCRLFVQIQLEAALHGNGLGDRPRTVFVRICRTLGISPLEFASLEAMLRMHRGAYGGYGPGARAGAGGNGRAAGGPPPSAKLADAYEVLGVAATAKDAEVTRAFRKLMSQNHPDKLVAQGLPESMVTAAHERTQRILEAYETIKGHRGIK